MSLTKLPVSGVIMRQAGSITRELKDPVSKDTQDNGAITVVVVCSRHGLGHHEPGSKLARISYRKRWCWHTFDRRSTWNTTSPWPDTSGASQTLHLL